MTPEGADKAQDWRGVDGATAWHLIHRHADGWQEVGAMMEAWLKANAAAPAASPASPWVDVHERLPDTDREVLVIHSFGPGRQPQLGFSVVMNAGSRNAIFAQDAISASKVTHWAEVGDVAGHLLDTPPVPPAADLGRSARMAEALAKRIAASMAAPGVVDTAAMADASRRDPTALARPLDGVRALPEQPERVESGAVQFGTDWPGVFIRGDAAWEAAAALASVIETGDAFLRAMLVPLYDLLRSCADGDAKNSLPAISDAVVDRLLHEAGGAREARLTAHWTPRLTRSARAGGLMPSWQRRAHMRARREAKTGGAP